jgi:hypothetical protein
MNDEWETHAFGLFAISKNKVPVCHKSKSANWRQCQKARMAKNLNSPVFFQEGAFVFDEVTGARSDPYLLMAWRSGGAAGRGLH